MFPLTLFGGLEQINQVPDQINLDRTGENLSHNDIRPSTNRTPKTPNLMRDEKIHSKLYPVKSEASNMDSNFGKGYVRKRPKHGREGSHCGLSDYSASTQPLIENTYSDQTRLSDQFILKREINITIRVH